MSNADMHKVESLEWFAKAQSANTDNVLVTKIIASDESFIQKWGNDDKRQQTLKRGFFVLSQNHKSHSRFIIIIFFMQTIWKSFRLK